MQMTIYWKQSDQSLIKSLETAAQKNRRSVSQEVLTCLQRQLTPTLSANGISTNGHSLNGHAPKPKIGRPLGSKTRSKYRER